MEYFINNCDIFGYNYLDFKLNVHQNFFKILLILKFFRENSLDMSDLRRQLMISKHKACTDRMLCLKVVLKSHYDLAGNPDMVNRGDTQDWLGKMIKTFNWLCYEIENCQPNDGMNYVVFKRKMQFICRYVDILNFQLTQIIEELFVKLYTI